MAEDRNTRSLDVLDDAAFQLMAENINDLLSLFDGEGRFLYANPAWRHSLGYDPVALVGRARVDLIHPDDAPRYRRHAEMATTLGGIPLDELQVRHRDGSWRTVESSGRMVRDEQGRPVREVLLWRDVTERRRNELLLFDQKRALEAMASGASSEEVLRTIAAIPESRLGGVRCAIFTRDRRAGRLRLACAPNLPPAMAKAIADLPLDGGFESWGTGGLPVPAMPDRPLPREALEIRQAAVANRIASAWSWPIAQPKYEPVGTLVLYATQITPPSREIREVAEAAAQLACTAMTARRSEEGTRQTQQRLAAHLDSWPLPSFECEPGGRLTWWSSQAERVLGWRAEDVVGRSITEIPLLPTEERSALKALLADLGAKRRDQRWVTRVRLRDGTMQATEMEIAALADEQGQARSLLFMLRDVTARQGAEAAQRQVRQLQDARPVASGASQLFAALGRNALRQLGQLRAALPPQSVAELEGLDATLREIMDRSAQLGMWAGEENSTGTALNLNDVVRDAIARLGPTLPARISLDSYLEPDLPSTIGSRGELYLVVSQLVMNAAEAIGSSRGFVRLSTDVVTLDEDELMAMGAPDGASPGEYALLEVTDTGPGASQEVIKQAKDPFFSTRGEGRGLGLAAAGGVLRGQGGLLRLRSQPGHGVTAQVYLPIDAAPEARLQGTALVASADPSAVSDLSRALRSAGLDVAVATTATDAVDLHRRNLGRFTVAVVDAILPNPGFDDTVTRLRAREPQLPILRLGDEDPDVDLPSVDPEAPDAVLVAAITRLLRRPG